MKLYKLYLFIVILMAGLIFGKVFGVNADPIQDSGLILPLSDQLIEGSKKVLIKHFSPY
jgi:hypothetical protein